MDLNCSNMVTMRDFFKHGETRDMHKDAWPILLLTILLAACEPPGDDAQPVQDFAAEARRIAQTSIIIDTHIDVPYRMQNEPADISAATDGGDFDYPRAVSGGLNVPFMSIYTSAKLEAEGQSRDAAEALIDGVETIVTGAPDKFAIARSTRDVRSQFEKGLISFALGMENGSPIEGELDNVRHFHDRGIRYITLTHSLSNHIADSSYDDNRQWNGLSDFGVEVVREMNRLGIMVDVSHLSDDAFWQVMQISEVPVVATHSSARHFTPDFERNMSSEMIKRLAEGGGVIQINFGSSFITHEARLYSSARSDEKDLFKAENPGLSDKEVEARIHPMYAQEHGPYPYATLEDVLNHFDHVVKLVGVDHVGIGSDYDGVGDSLPIGLKDVAAYPTLIEGLLRRGYGESDIRKILGENLLRVWDAAEAYARQAQQQL